MLRVGLCQLLVGSDKVSNVKNALKAIRDCAKKGAEIVCLPEIFVCPYSNDSFGPYSESIPDGYVCKELLASAQEHKIYLVGGSIPEKDANGKLYNTCIVASPEGKMIAKHRKVHLFDVNVPNKITFRESATLTAGNSVTTFDTPHGKMGVAICYDIRFPELALCMASQGCKMLFYPGAFSTGTGPTYWELLARARAVDTQCFVAVTSPARNPASAYQAWGHSSVVAPTGEVIATTGHDEDVIIVDVDFKLVDEVRANIPVFTQRRYDVYNNPSKQVIKSSI